MPESGPPRSIPPSIPATASLLVNAVKLLGEVERLPETRSGALRFGRRGLLLVESRRICWAVANGMEQRLTELLRRQRNPPLSRTLVEDMFRECKQAGRNLGEMLLESGDVSEAGLRAALFRHTAEAVAHMARAGAKVSEFVPYSGERYDARFSFSPTEIFASLGARRDRALAAAARAHLRQVLVPEAAGAAFVRDRTSPLPVIVATEACESLEVEGLIEMCTWAAEAFGVAEIFDEQANVAAASGRGRDPLIAWRDDDTHYVALCPSRPVSALQLKRVEAIDRGARS